MVIKDPFAPKKKAGLLTSFEAPKVAASSFQPTPAQMLASRQSDIRPKLVSGFKSALSKVGNLNANILGAATGSGKKTAATGSYSQQFVGPGGLIEPNYAVGAQTKQAENGTKLLAGAATSQTAPPTPTEAPTKIPTETAAATGASGASAPGSVGAGAGGYVPEGFSKMEESQSGLDADLQRLADTDPELADSIMDKLGYSKGEAVSAGGTG